MDYFGIPGKKLEDYSKRYAGSPAIAYIRLIAYAVKALVKHCFLPIFRFGGRKGKNRVALVLMGGIGDILIGGLYAKHLLKKIQGKNIHLDIFVSMSLDNARSLFWGTDVFPYLKSKSSYKAYNYDVEISLSMMFPRAVVCSECGVTDDFLKSYIENLKKFERESTWILTDDRQLNQLIWMLGGRQNRISALDATGDLALSDDLFLRAPESGLRVFERFEVLRKKPYITISRGVDSQNSYKDSTRLWSVDKYEDLLGQLKRQYPDLLIVYLGSDKNACAPIKGIDLDLVGETSLSELMAVLDRAKVHFDMECGMVHIRHFLNRRPSIVIFGPTSPTLKGYPENINIRNDSACVLPMCEHVFLQGEWSKVCFQNKTCRGACVESVSVRQAMDAFRRLL